MKTYTKANKLNTISTLALLWLGSFGVFGQVAQEPDWVWGKKIGGTGGENKIATDQWGNVFTTRWFTGTLILGTDTLIAGSNQTTCIVKYDPIGQVLWARQPIGKANYKDIAVDNQGNVYTTGMFNFGVSFGSFQLNTSSNNDEIFLAKYNSLGTPQWARKIGSSNDSKNVYGVSVDYAGNPYIHGDYSNFISFGLGSPVSLSSLMSGYDCFLAKFNPQGTPIWARKIGGPYWQKIKSVSINPLGEILVLGNGSYDPVIIGNVTLPANSGNDFIAKFNMDGVLLKAVNLGYFGNRLATDASGNYSIVGFYTSNISFGNGINLTPLPFGGGGGEDIYVAKFDSSGTALWARRAGNYVENDRATAVCFDVSGNLYVTGLYVNTCYFNNIGSSINLPWGGGGGYYPDAFVAKYKPDGTVVWARRAGGGGLESGMEIAVDVAENVFVLADFNGGSNAITMGDFIFQYDAEILGKIGNTPINLPTTSLITGVLFKEKNTNCLPDSTESTLKGKVIKVLPGPFYTMSNQEGTYQVRLPNSNQSTSYTISTIPWRTRNFQVVPVCPIDSVHTFSIGGEPDTLSNKDFGFEISPCHQLDVQLASNRRRRCFQNTTSVSYQNQGSLSAPDAYLLVEFPHWVRPISASRSHVAVNDSVWRFNLDTVSAGEYGSFTITDSVICGNVNTLGLNQCTKATIYPAPDCPPPAGYNGAEVTVSGKCNDGFVSLGIYNKSNTDMADSVNYWVYLDSIQLKQAKVKLAAGDSLKLWVETHGWAVHLTVNQIQNHPTELFVSTTVESCGDTFIFIPRQTVNRFAKQQTPSSKTHCLEIRGAYDPNDKQAFPIGFTNQNIIPPNTQLEYLVRFQNTGNDTAFTVYVIDTLDNNLNPETIELGATSHNYQLSMQTVKSGKTFLRWQFNNIQLPDSNVNEPASNGFIQFRISPKPGLALGSKVRNHAEIYFDFNPPIITNQTLSTYDVIVYKDSTLNDNLLTTQPLAPTLSTVQITGVGLQSAVSGGNISTSGGPTVSARGVVWNTMPAPTIALNSKTQDGSGPGNFTSNLTGLQPNTLYYVRAYATNSVGTSYGEERSFTTLSPATVAAVSTGAVSDITTNSAITSNAIGSDGGATVSERGVVWNSLPAPTIALSTKTQDGSGPGNFTSNLTGLQPNTLYYVRAYATNSVGTSYGEERSFTTLSPATVAAVSTGTVSDITNTSAITSNTISSDGGATISERGVVWNTLPAPTIALITKTQDGSGSGNFTSNLTGLQPNTLYYVRAYATNSVGTSYGEERSFTTLLVGIEDLDEQKKIRIYPNPVSKGLLHVEFSTLGSLRLFDARGKLMLEETQISGLKTISISLKPGFYFAKAHTVHGSQIIKLVVE